MRLVLHGSSRRGVLHGFPALIGDGCRFPGCGRRAVASDIDHTVDWAFDGRTEHGNLARLCRKHHRLKHRTGWRMRQEGGGVIRWDSPAGRVYRSRPEHPFAPGSAATPHANSSPDEVGLPEMPPWAARF